MDDLLGRTARPTIETALPHAVSIALPCTCSKKVASPLIRESPEQPPAKSVLPLRSRRLAAQSLSRVPTYRRGEVLIMQRMGYIKGPSVPSASELEAFDNIFNGNLTASNVEALFPDGEKGSSRQPRRRKATSWVAPLRRF
jgi:hypothetical protein